MTSFSVVHIRDRAHGLLRCAGMMAALALTVVAWSAPAEPDRKMYVLPADDAAVALHRFAEFSGVQVMYIVEQVRGVRTNPVNQRCTAREAVERMLAKTDLCVVEDRETGALMIRRKKAPASNPKP